MPVISVYELIDKLNLQMPANKPILAPGQVHIWKVDLDKPDFAEDAQSILSPDERRRAGRMRSALKRTHFTTARTALRQLLSIYTRQPAQSLRFGYSPLGKPSLLESTRFPTLEFNISHSGALMLAAFSLDGALGIDLECEQATSTRDWIVNRYFSANDYQIYQILPADQKQAAFLRAWTAKEACGKAHGKGFSAPLNMDHFRLEDADQFPEEPEFIRYGEYWLLHFRTGNGVSAAAAVKTARKPQPLFWEYRWNFTRNYEQIAQNRQLDSFFED